MRCSSSVTTKGPCRRWHCCHQLASPPCSPQPPIPHPPRRWCPCPCQPCCPSAPSASVGMAESAQGGLLTLLPTPGGVWGFGGVPTRYWNSQTSPSWGLSPARSVLLLDVRMLNLRNLRGRDGRWERVGTPGRGCGGDRDPRGMQTGVGTPPGMAGVVQGTPQGLWDPLGCHLQRSPSSHPLMLGGSLQDTRGGQGLWDPQGWSGGVSGRVPPVDVDLGLHVVVAVVQPHQEPGAG